jgi:uncharacterized protein (DUF433 family)
MPIPNIPYNPITIESLPREGVPLHNHPDGQVRIIGTRISLEIFLEAHKLGARTPEQLARRFDTVKLADAKAVLAYYRDNKTEVDKYLRLSTEKAERIREEITSQPEYIKWKEEMLERGRAI